MFISIRSLAMSISISFNFKFDLNQITKKTQIDNRHFIEKNKTKSLLCMYIIERIYRQNMLRVLECVIICSVCGFSYFPVIIL